MDSQSEEAAPCLCRPKQPVGLVFWTEAGRAPTARVIPIGGCRSLPASGSGGERTFTTDTCVAFVLCTDYAPYKNIE
eukprot:scaffold101298_cov57-Attheya_sp.AAC.3